MLKSPYMAMYRHPYMVTCQKINIPAIKAVSTPLLSYLNYVLCRYPWMDVLDIDGVCNMRGDHSRFGCCRLPRLVFCRTNSRTSLNSLLYRGSRQLLEEQ